MDEKNTVSEFKSQQISTYKELQNSIKIRKSILTKIKITSILLGIFTLPILIGFVNPYASIILSIFFIYPFTYFATTTRELHLSIIGLATLFSIAILSIHTMIDRNFQTFLFENFLIIICSIIIEIINYVINKKSKQDSVPRLGIITPIPSDRQLIITLEPHLEIDSINQLDRQLQERVEKEWSSLFLKSGKDLTLAEVEDDIFWLYDQIELPKPSIFVLDGYFTQKLFTDCFTHNASSSNNICKKVICQSRDSYISNNIRPKDIFRRQLGKQVVFQIGQDMKTETGKIQHYEESILLKYNFWQFMKKNQIMNDVRIQSNFQIRDLDIKFSSQGFIPSSCVDLLGYYDYLERIGVVTNQVLQRFLNIMKKGVYEIVFYENCVFISKLPIKILCDDQNRFHSLTQPAIQWRDGLESYHIHGVEFERSVWEQVVKRDLNVNQILEIKNVEQRRIALQIYGSDKLFSELKSRLINRSQRGNELYGLSGLASLHVIKILVYSCPSTSRVYTSFVPDHITTADEGMAWKFGLSEEQYAQLRIEA